MARNWTFSRLILDEDAASVFSFVCIYTLYGEVGGKRRVGRREIPAKLTIIHFFRDNRLFVNILILYGRWPRCSRKLPLINDTINFHTWISAIIRNFRCSDPFDENRGSLLILQIRRWIMKITVNHGYGAILKNWEGKISGKILGFL